MSAQVWHNLDAKADYEFCCNALEKQEARNFAVRFNASSAQCTLDLSRQPINTLLEEPVSGGFSVRLTRWFNFWASSGDADAITAIANHYGVSSRLTSLLRTTRAKSSDTKPINRECEWATAAKTREARSRASDLDLEGLAGNGDSLPTHASSIGLPNFGDIFGNLWHFCSVDRGPGYVYVGFNSLFTVPGADVEPDADVSKPHGLRLWTSLLLCHDGTVVSIFEQPPDGTPPEHIKFARRNVMNVFRHLSSLHSRHSTNTLLQVDVRPTDNSGQSTSTDTDSASLLFYYLFDDWITTLNLITQRYNPYREKLELIRQKMFDSASTDLIRSTDVVGRQLKTLELMYKSYELVIVRLLKPRTSIYPSDQPMRSSHHVHGLPGHSLEDTEELTSTAPGPRSQPGVDLSLPALLRFERLLDRIRLYALVEIQECVKERDSLALMVSILF
jgi:hypothetical protein